MLTLNFLKSKQKETQSVNECTFMKRSIQKTRSFMAFRAKRNSHGLLHKGSQAVKQGSPQDP